MVFMKLRLNDEEEAPSQKITKGTYKKKGSF